jgi:Rad3-related DNA helicase
LPGREARERVNATCRELSRAIDELLLAEPRKTLVVEPEIQRLLRVARLRRDAGRSLAAIGDSRREETWQQIRAALGVR